MTATDGLTRAQVTALTALASGPCRITNRNDVDARTVSQRTVAVLERDGLAIDVDGARAIATDDGRTAAADLPDPPAPTRDHGTNACYTLDQCRCGPCRHAGVEYRRQLERDRAYGRPRMVDAAPVRDHVRDLMASGVGATDGVGLKRIARLSGVSHGALSKLVYGDRHRGPSRRVKAATADKVMAVTAADRAPGSVVDAGPTVERLGQLRAAGATWTELGKQLDATGSNTQGITRSTAVTVATARAVHDLWTRWQHGDWTPVGRRSPWPARRANTTQETADG